MSEFDINRIILDQLEQPLWSNWYIKGELGRGASSVVYRIEAERGSRTDVSALKIEPLVVDEDMVHDPEKRRAMLERKRRDAENETNIMYKLRGAKNIVFYEDEDIRKLTLNGKDHGYYLLIRMEYLTCVHDLMRRRKFDLSEKNVLKLAADIGNGIKSAHDIGVIHRDIKPGNFFVASDGTYKLGDFNISKRTVSTRSFAGTEGYIAPEIYRAKYNADSEYTKQADIYSFGISLYCLMNDYLFPFGDTCLPAEAIVKRMDGFPLPPPKNASPEFAAVILKACAFSLDARYKSIDEMLYDISRISSTQPADRAQGAVPMPAGDISGKNDPQTAYVDDTTANNAVSSNDTVLVDDDQTAYVDDAPVAPVSSNDTVLVDNGQTSYVDAVSSGPVSQRQFINENPIFAAPVAASEKKGKLKYIIIALLVLLLLAAAGFFIFNALSDNDDGDESKGSSSSYDDDEDEDEDDEEEKTERSTKAEPTEDEQQEVTEHVTEKTTAETSAATTTTVKTTVTTTSTTTTTAPPLVLCEDEIYLEEGIKAAVFVTKYPSGSDETHEVWSSDNESVASVNQMGEITAVSPGVCSVTLKLKNAPGITAGVKVYVSERTKSVTAVGSANIISGGYASTDGSKIFFSNGKKILRVVTDESGEVGAVDVANANAFYMNNVGDYIYYCDADNDFKLCRIKADGTGKTVICDHYCSYLIYNSGWLYFSEYDGKTNYISRIRPNGTGYDTIAEVNPQSICILGGRIYFVNTFNDYSIDSIKVGGDDYKVMYEPDTKDAMDLCVNSGRIFFTKGRHGIYSIAADGGDEQCVLTDDLDQYNIRNGEFYVVRASELYHYNSSSGSLEDIATIGGSPVILDDLLFSYNENGEFSWAIFD